MSWTTFKLNPQSEAAQEFLEQYPDNVLEMVDIWNDFRTEKYNSKDRVFGYTTGDLPNEELPELLSEDFETVRAANEEQWQRGFIRYIENPDADAVTDELPSYYDAAEWGHESILFDEMFHSLTKYKITIETTYGNEYVYRFETPIQDASRISDLSMPILNYDNSNNFFLELYIEDDDVERIVQPTAEDYSREERLFESSYPIVNLLGVYSGVLDVGLFEVGGGKVEEAEQVFETLGFHFQEIETDYYVKLFLITYSDEKASEFEEFTESIPNATLEDVYDILNLPTSGAESITELETQTGDNYEVLPGLEYVTYGLQSGDIEYSLALSWPYVYYHPPFSIEGAKTALLDGEQLYEELLANKNIFSKIQGEDISPLVDEFISMSERSITRPDTLSSVTPHRIQ